MWLKELKIAIIEKDVEKLGSLVQELPALSEKKDIDEALHLIHAATALLTELREDTKSSMIQLKKHIDFMKSTQAPSTGNFDITS